MWHGGTAIRTGPHGREVRLSKGLTDGSFGLKLLGNCRVQAFVWLQAIGRIGLYRGSLCVKLVWSCNSQGFVLRLVTGNSDL